MDIDYEIKLDFFKRNPDKYQELLTLKNNGVIEGHIRDCCCDVCRIERELGKPEVVVSEVIPDPPL